MGRSQQRKGAAGERELVEALREYGYAVNRGGSMTFGSVPDVYGLRGIHVEVKRVERLNISKAMRQAVKDKNRFHDGVPCVFHRKNREPWMVTMLLEDWIELYKGRRQWPMNR